ncbi:MAG TPA: response regulator transcription factor, partial [Thermomicrobiales bacterium]|nr:response regulator transcription factor [Thermomicrobiales bacterium]
LDSALMVARDIGDRTQIASALTGLAHIVHLEGEHRAAVDLMRDAMRSFERGRHLAAALMCLDGIANMALALGDGRHAAWCIGAVDGMTERTGFARQEAVQGEHQARVDAVIAAIGRDAWHEAWAAGRALEPEAVLADAYAWQPPIGVVSSGTTTAVSRMPEEAELLSPRELEVLRLMADGLTNQEIAEALYLSHRTATSHASNILGKLGLTTRTAAVAYAIRSGLA